MKAWARRVIMDFSGAKAARFNVQTNSLGIGVMGATLICIYCVHGPQDARRATSKVSKII
jgi:hypothetical protein